MIAEEGGFWCGSIGGNKVGYWTAYLGQGRPGSRYVKLTKQSMDIGFLFGLHTLFSNFQTVNSEARKDVLAFWRREMSILKAWKDRTMRVGENFCTKLSIFIKILVHSHMLSGAQMRNEKSILAIKWDSPHLHVPVLLFLFSYLTNPL